MANTQTSVPVFTIGQVLTAQQQNQINTGIPVFADSTARDAAFGGTGEKTLAEGQFAFLEDTDTTQYYDGSSWQAVGASITAATTQTNSTQTTSSVSYADLATVTSVTLTTGTTAFAFWHVSARHNELNGTVFVSCAVSGATTIAASDDWCGRLGQPVASAGFGNIASGTIFTLTPGSNTFTIKYRLDGGGQTGTLEYRGLQVIAL
jgi:hypothetical protein